MQRYIALLRGINISGKNKIPMAELKKNFETLAFTNVKTYLNSGNVIFSTDEKDTNELSNTIESMIKQQFNIDVPTFVILQEDLIDVLTHAPEWWGQENEEIYDNLIFIMQPLTFTDVYNEIGEPKEGLEQIDNYNSTVFWSFNLKDYRKTNWWSKTINTSVACKLTIRTANTVRKISKM